MDTAIYPSALVRIVEDRYYEAVAALRGLPGCRFDGQVILVPETHLDAINMLVTQLDAQIELGRGEEGAFIAFGQKAGLSPQLLSAGSCEFSSDGLTPSEAVALAQVLVAEALSDPAGALLRWLTAYRSSFEPC